MEAKYKDNKEQLAVRVDPEIRHALKVKAALERRTAGSIVEELLRSYLADPKPTTAKG